MGIRYNPEIMVVTKTLIFLLLLSAISLGCTGPLPVDLSSPQSSSVSNNYETFELTTFPTISTGNDTPDPIPVYSSTPSEQVHNQKEQLVETTQPPQLAETITPTVYDPDSWTSLPVIPKLGPKVNEIYARGLNLGNNPNAFSKIGDCGSTPAWFLGDFDRGSRYYDLGEYQELTEVIDYFQGSYARTSLAAKSGFNASSIFSSLWSDRQYCQSNEAPMLCEYRENKPSFAIITLGTNDVWHQDTFESQMRKIIEISIEYGVVPILSTKADNREGDGSINSTIARLAVEYQVPLWNYWLALQPLPDQGLQEDGSHLTWGPNQFDNPQVLQRAWPIRNLTALQVLDEVWRYVNSP